MIIMSITVATEKRSNILGIYDKKQVLYASLILSVAAQF